MYIIKMSYVNLLSIARESSRQDFKHLWHIEEFHEFLHLLLCTLHVFQKNSSMKIFLFPTAKVLNFSRINLENFSSSRRDGS